MRAAAEQAAVGVRVDAHASSRPLGAMSASRDGTRRSRRRALRACSCASILRAADMVGLLAEFVEGHLMGAPGVFDGLAIDFLGSGPALGRAHDEHGPAGALGRILLRGRLSGCGDAVEDGVEDLGGILVHREPDRRLRGCRARSRSRASGLRVRHAECGRAPWDSRSCSR